MADSSIQHITVLSATAEGFMPVQWVTNIYCSLIFLTAIHHQRYIIVQELEVHQPRYDLKVPECALYWMNHSDAELLKKYSM